MIVPNLPPQVCGVYDYTRKLAEHWPTRDEWTLVCPQDGRPWTGANAVRIERSGKSLSCALASLEPDAIGLQYTCFGYAHDGVPTWLAEGLEQFKRNGQARLAVMFHEFAYDGSFWRRAHWRKPRQEALAVRLCRVADAALTGIPEHQQAVREATGRNIGLAVIPSNIDPVTTSAHEGPLVFGVFGLPGTRAKALAGHKRLIAGLAKSSPQIKVREIGSDKDKAISDAAVSRALAACDAVLSPYEAAFIWKSGAAMAAFAHGCAVIALGSPKLGGPPVLTYGRSVGSMMSMSDRVVLRDAGQAGNRWYVEHSGWPRAVAAWHAALTR